MKGKWSIGKIIGLVIAVISLVCILISIFFKEGNNIFLNIGLLGVCIDLILFIFINEKNN